MVTSHKPPLLLLHGAVGSAAQFEALIPLLAEYFDVYFPDFEGHGPRPSERDFRIEHFAENAVDFLEHQIHGPVDVFGYSMGGYVAVWLARTHPDRIGRVLTLATKYLWTPDAAAREIGLINPDKIEAKVPQFARALEARHSALGWREVLTRTAAMLTGLGEHNLLAEEVLRTIPHPIRVAVGDRDTTVSVEESAAVYRALPNAQLQVLPGTPHPLEKIGAERLAAFIMDWAGG